MQKECTLLESVTGDEYGGKIRIKGDGGSRRGTRSKRARKTVFLYISISHVQFILLARERSWVVVFKRG